MLFIFSGVLAAYCRAFSKNVLRTDLHFCSCFLILSNHGLYSIVFAYLSHLKENISTTYGLPICQQPVTSTFLVLTGAFVSSSAIVVIGAMLFLRHSTERKKQIKIPSKEKISTAKHESKL